MTAQTDMDHYAEFVFETPYADKIYRVLAPEAGSDPGEKSYVELTATADAIQLKINAEDVSAMRASLNMWLRLIAVSSEILAL